MKMKGIIVAMKQKLRRASIQVMTANVIIDQDVVEVQSLRAQGEMKRQRNTVILIKNSIAMMHVMTRVDSAIMKATMGLKGELTPVNHLRNTANRATLITTTGPMLNAMSSRTMRGLLV